MTHDELPPPGTVRWVKSRKAKMVAAVRLGLLTLEQVVRSYGISVEEFERWQTIAARHGTDGLAAEQIQIVRVLE